MITFLPLPPTTRNKNKNLIIYFLDIKKSVIFLWNTRLQSQIIYFYCIFQFKYFFSIKFSNIIFFQKKTPYIVASFFHYLNGHSPSGSLDTHIYFISNPRVYHINVHVCVRNSRISYAVNYKCIINKVTCINH